MRIRKRIAAPVLALAIALVGWFFGYDDIVTTTNPNTVIHESVPSALADIKKEGLAPNKYIDVFVVKVTDGDTMEVTYKGETHKVRMLCVDTPESVKRGVKEQPYSKKASEFTKEMILNKSVRLVFDKGLRDRYGRLLAYVVLKDNTLLNGTLVRNGYARVEIVSPNSSMKDYFYDLQDKAVREGLGFWGLPEDEQPFLPDEKGNYMPRYKLDEAA